MILTLSTLLFDLLVTFNYKIVVNLDSLKRLTADLAAGHLDKNLEVEFHHKGRRNS